MNNVKPVILAGGLGSRLRPYTWVVPKPLLPIGERPIIQMTINWLRSYGFKEVAIALGYRGELIQAYLGDGKKFGIEIHYVQEDQRLGTAGPLTLLKDWIEDDDLLSINGDLVTQLNLENFVKAHESNDMTIAARNYEVKLPFGVLKLDENKELSAIDEKPTIHSLVSAGIYLLSPYVIKELDYLIHLDKGNEYCDMTKLITFLLRARQPGAKVAPYVFTEPWIAIEHLGDFNTAINGEWIQWADSLEHRLLQLTNTEG